VSLLSSTKERENPAASEVPQGYNVKRAKKNVGKNPWHVNQGKIKGAKHPLSCNANPMGKREPSLWSEGKVELRVLERTPLNHSICYW